MRLAITNINFWRTEERKPLHSLADREALSSDAKNGLSSATIKAGIGCKIAGTVPASAQQMVGLSQCIDGIDTV